MNLKKIKQLNDALDALPTIIEKLNYYKQNYLDKYPGVELCEYFECKTKEELVSEFSDYLSGPLRLPINRKHLVPSLETPNNGTSLSLRIEYHYWILHYKAEVLFKEHYQPFYEKEVLKPLGDSFLRGELNGIKNAQQKALNLLNDEYFELYNLHDVTAEKLYLWYANNYYQEFIEWTVDYKSHVENVCTYKHILPFLQLLIDNRDGILYPESFNIINIDTEALAKMLLEKGYFQESYLEDVIAWLNGNPMERKIRIIKPANHFVSIIASIIDEKRIKNSPEYCANYICNNVLFKNKIRTFPYILKLMNKNNSLRITLIKDSRFFSIAPFIIK